MTKLEQNRKWLDDQLAAARRYRAERAAQLAPPRAYLGPYPIRDHPTCAEWR